ncbi:cysteine-rich receptor-like protein kinase 44 [Cryptomeria japonica]|uniref:cysteine-rich receptor-like protein kinase 44 n=1 Tax=Cryptomeria japonica TaxID=3369 RepID=UPI0027DA8C7E|nr:cysteine-rich receptor-like protein kinase 44 [Cryptomeria japonica]
MCNENNYTSSKFESNLNIVLNNLVNNTSSKNGFSTSVSGQTPDRAYGLLQCWRDATVDDCFRCSQEAHFTIRQQCGNASGGRAWLPKCFIRYENYSFAGILDTRKRTAHTLDQVTTDPEGFSTAVRALFRDLSDEALRSPIRYSSGSTTTSSFYTIYSQVQCWNDLTSVEDCKTCLKNAIGELLDARANRTYLGGMTGSGSCFARYEIFPFFNPSAPIQKPSSSPLIPILVIVGCLLVILLLCLFAIRRKFKSVVFWKPAFLRKENSNTQLDSTIGQENVIIFNLENIKAATRNFHDDNKLGEGGFGSVYKGTMLDGKQIAVKKLSIRSLQGKREFLNEVKLVAKIQHRNLVKLLGCCNEQSEKLLVYEFLSNKSLDKILFHPERSKELDWPKRFNIIHGVARGLLYLHEDSQIRIIHRDIKASNILLDEKMEPKISDFGLARLIPQDESHVETRVTGTYGYMAPEYAMLGQLSTKADVYSFGVVILEILCGRKNIDNRLSPNFQSLLERVWRSYIGGDIVDVIDNAIVESFSSKQVSRCMHVALLCTQEDASLRPPMPIVFAMLSNPDVANLPYPTTHTYFNVNHKHVLSHTLPSTSIGIRPISLIPSTTLASINDVSLTILSPR